jgi:hypothetical protein
MPIYTAAGRLIEIADDRIGWPTSPDPDPRTCDYIHFDLTTEQLGQTWRYNCWGFTFLPRRYWISHGSDVDKILEDNCDVVPDGSVRVGDVIRYRDDRGYTTHTGRVWRTDGAGHATRIRSKWGSLGEYIHEPLCADLPTGYGTALAYFRQRAPLRGIADLWVRDSPGDNGEQFPGRPWWTSPDIFVDVPPYDGTPDEHPVFDHPNRVWTVVSNRSSEPVEEFYVQYYWADPAAGLSPSDWHLIPGTREHPNPAGPIRVDGDLSVEAPYVEWTPTAAPAHQCLLAIAYVHDDPTDSYNPDPLVYPFNIPWDNNIAQRNVHVVRLEGGNKSGLSIHSGYPFDDNREVNGSVHVVLTYTPPRMGFPRKVIPLEAAIVLNGRKKSSLKSWKDYLKMGGTFKPDLPKKLQPEKLLAGTVFPDILYEKKNPHKIDIEVAVPKEVKAGSVYSLHIAQYISHTVTGGYTVVIIVK